MTTTALADEWGVKQLDLDTYLKRIGRPGLSRARPCGQTLRLLHRAHVETIPFENIDIVLERGVPTSIADLQQKLVASGRGGYCHEHSLLFGAVLDQLGYRVDRLLARPRERPGRPWPRTHLTLRVRGSDGEWLADVGFGSGLLEPLPLAEGAWCAQGGWSFRLARHDEGWQLLERAGTGKNPLYAFGGRGQRAADVDAANYYTSTHPESPFTGQLVVMQRLGGELRRLLNREFSRVLPDGTCEKTSHLDDEDLAKVLTREFRLTLNAHETRELLARVADVRSSLAPPPVTTPAAGGG
ncbi:Arylamine N-acetyltransferase [Streptomyces sp. YIM 121038]|uniref:arylamine N-acetyltransferase family protein n=1 Tax=Streptomyces sp. YIM 121038 TaxID=2136401 RepID=UPI0011100263|nr:arylamine N-acetyltransferase [Streptomyces sp. YIM 121038]QCX80826.1 Arylamine N-acetyltransferase [Streptomyces sp. YIM 121038]